jgi:predicted lipoprotein with Yx(FWY)xxD motif
MSRFASAVAVLAVLALGAAPSLMAKPAATAPVAKLRTTSFGYVLTRRNYQALYYWQVEKRAGGKVRCTGTCAKLWPPLLVRSTAVAKTVAGIKGRFGVIRRPDGKLQVTHRGLPVYTYAHEGPREVRCNNVDGWFVVRV